METMTFQEMLERPPQPQAQLIERVNLPANGQFPQEKEKLGWTVQKLKKKAAVVRNTLPKIEDDVHMVASFTNGLEKIGRYRLDDSFSNCSEESLIRSLQSYESFIRKARSYASSLKKWEENWSDWIVELSQRHDIPAPLMENLVGSFNKLRSVRSKYEQSWDVLQSFDIPIHSSILLALAKFRELTA